MRKRDVVKKSTKTVGKKKAPDPELPSDEEIRELESMALPEKVIEEVCREVAERVGISVEEVREIMKKLESGIPSRKPKK